MPAKRGRPSKYTPELSQEICERLSKGETLASICRDDKMPGVQTVSDWRDKYETFSVNFARAREEGYDAIAQECLDIADESRLDTSEDKNGNLSPNGEWMARSRLRVETRLKLLAKWCPKKYGEKVEVEQTGEVKVKLFVGGVPHNGG